jgi:chemotaxis protein methyltransferase WspC
MAFADFEKLLKESMGLDAASIGASGVERAVLERALACGLADPRAYWQRVGASPGELQALIEAVVVPETWFFRDRGAFSTLAHLVQGASLTAHPDGVRRILSLPSSTGEEPYSIAMALFDAGVPADRFSIDAVDISAHAIAVASRATYGKNSFRGRELGFRSRYFDATATGHRLADKVRVQVHFRQGNLLAPDSPAEPTGYDAVFCRNLLIYFDRATQDRAIAALERLLTPRGVVFVAPSETGVMLNYGFVPVKAPFAFAFRKAGPAAGDRKPDNGRSGRSRVAASPSLPVAAPPPRPPVARTADPSALPSAAARPDAVVNLSEAAELANRGQFEEAVERCEQHLRQSGPSAEAFHLMGLIRDASGDPTEAAICYRKALYLDPDHGEALIHLALLLEKAGKKSEAQLLRKRTNRLQQKSRSKDAPTL